MLIKNLILVILLKISLFFDEVFLSFMFIQRTPMFITWSYRRPVYKTHSHLIGRAVPSEGNKISDDFIEKQVH